LGLSELLQFRQSNQNWVGRGHSGANGERAAMTYRGIEYKLKMVEPGIWKYRFYVGRGIKIGTTKTDLESVAVQRTQKRIDRELKIAGDYESA
jgi:hypothetical protein